MTDLKKRIIYPKDAGLAVIIPCDCGLTVEEIAKKDVPANVPYKIVDASEIPADRTFRGAWEISADTVFDININKAKAITHDIRRSMRAEEFIPLDQKININIANATKVAEVEAQRQAIRDKYATIQNSIDTCSTADELKVIIRSL